jgi:hypothetical protein
MTVYADLLVTSARIVAPEEAAANPSELAMMRLMLTVARMAGAPFHIVKFDDGIVAMVASNPNDTKAWNALLAATHAAALSGHIGPVSVDARG